MSSPRPISLLSPHSILSRPCHFPSSSTTSNRERLIARSPMANGSPSHISAPIHIEIPRHRLFSPTSEESQDSGFNSPTHHPMRRMTLQEYSNVIYENCEDEPSNLMHEPVFKFEEEEQEHYKQQSLLMIASPVRRSLAATSPARKSIDSPVRRSITATSPIRNASTRQSYVVNSPVIPQSSDIDLEYRQHLFNPIALSHSNSASLNEHHLHQHHRHFLPSPYRTSPGGTGWFGGGIVGYEGGRGRSRSDPSAPPFHLQEEIEGYELTREFSSVFMLAPPCYEPPPPYEEVEQQTHKAKRSLSEEDAVDALSKFIANNCCYGSVGKDIAKHMKPKEIRPGNGHQYKLESFYEERTTIWYQEPYTNQIIDGPENGPPPKAWDITVDRPTMFQAKEVYEEVPHTASIRDCTYCHGKGTKQCSSCHGNGTIKCSICDGLGILHHFSPDEMSYDRSTASAVKRSCQQCVSGRKKCKQCEGSGRKTCKTCQGHGSLKTYIRLAVKWKVLKADKVFECSRVPNKCIAQVSGSLVFQEENDRVFPLVDFPEEEINGLSRALINNHKEQLNHARIIMQRHCVREIPVSEVRSEWKRKEFTYWVYGNENHVYCPDYPVKCYNNCNIL